MVKSFFLSSVGVFLVGFAVLLSGSSVRIAQGADKPAAAEASGGGKDAAQEGGHGVEHHDENDLAHANATHDLMSLQELRSDLAIYSFILFLLLFGVLLKFAWRPIMQGLQKREETMASLLAEAQANATRSEAAVREHEAKLAAANEEVRTLLADARRSAEEVRESIVNEARVAAQKERERAVADINSAKQAALSEIAESSVKTAISLAGRILHREIGPQDHDRLAREAAEQFTSNN